MFAGKIVEGELELLRLSAKPRDAPVFGMRIDQPENRGERIDRLTGFLKEYEAVVAVCAILRRRFIEMNAEECAEQFRELLRQRGAT